MSIEKYPHNGIDYYLNPELEDILDSEFNRDCISLHSGIISSDQAEENGVLPFLQMARQTCYYWGFDQVGYEKTFSFVKEHCPHFNPEQIMPLPELAQHGLLEAHGENGTTVYFPTKKLIQLATRFGSPEL